MLPRKVAQTEKGTNTSGSHMECVDIYVELFFNFFLNKTTFYMFNLNLNKKCQA